METNIFTDLWKFTDVLS